METLCDHDRFGTAASVGLLSSWLTVLLATSCGLIVANLYYAQPLIGPIAADLGCRRSRPA